MESNNNDNYLTGECEKFWDGIISDKGAPENIEDKGSVPAENINSDATEEKPDNPGNAAEVTVRSDDYTISDAYIDEQIEGPFYHSQESDEPYESPRSEDDDTDPYDNDNSDF